MNFIEDLRGLDPKDVGRWPFLYRALTIGLLFVVLTGALIYFIPIRTQMPDLDRARSDEASLMQTFDDKQRKAANIDAYKAQLKEMERSFGAMLRQLPGRTEVPSLLVDISQTGLAAGLQEKLFQPAPEVKKDFYAELPIKIRLSGSYHEFGTFVSGIAALPRIVTLHDIAIVPEGRDSGPDRLTLDVTAKTYRYLEDAETAPADKGKPAAPAAPAAGGGNG
ncbi:MAG TPA: type 4a pilus biogenesis protein PilO [Steroidobacteraceae bacterium]|nr:type 4a pilus biogenesis protein PilO [Steroidobacteraceae bacterium]